VTFIAYDKSYFIALFASVLARLAINDITYETFDDKFVIYDGVDINHNDILDADSLSQRNLTELIAYKGAAVIGGNDVIIGTDHGDRLYGGAGFDIYIESSDGELDTDGKGSIDWTG
jgi:hypothetical protein